ncbi:hypothetical protein GCM10009530_35240 [Microbispora corallina]|uniref:Trypsin-co-occurring domain-containing protein n=1 Tax=Microbispora corallina TaxID=83302 RepID=A0ABQ4FYP2_9ACTN|nr:CU044_2847 family protein [Microbispora corallina]GIH39940.1 hypothetical protein Mco01_29400 [Microbispora corallina]
MAEDDGTALVPVRIGETLVYVTVRGRPAGQDPAALDEEDIAFRPPRLEDALDGLMGVARAVGERLRQTEASSASVEFGCDFTVESGSFVAVVGKASATSAFKVTLEWAGPRS